MISPPPAARSLTGAPSRTGIGALPDGARARPRHCAPPADRRPGPPDASAAEIQRRPRDHRAVAERNQRRRSWRAGGCGPCSAPWTCLAFISRLSTSGRSKVHERTVAEIFAAVTPGFDYLRPDEEERVALLRERAAVAAPARLSRSIAYGEETAGELELFCPPRGRFAKIWLGAIRASIISNTDSSCRTCWS